MRECVWARFSGDTRAPPIRFWLFYFLGFLILCICLFLRVSYFRTQWGSAASWWTFGEWQVEAEEHGLVFFWDWLSGSRWLPDSFCQRRPSWRKPDRNGRQTPPAVGWTGLSEMDTTESNGHRRITVRRWPNLSPCHQKYDQNLGRKSTEAKQLIRVEATAKLFPSAAELLYLLFDHAVDEVVHFSGKVAEYLLKGINLQLFFYYRLIC